MEDLIWSLLSEIIFAIIAIALSYAVMLWRKYLADKFTQEAVEAGVLFAQQIGKDNADKLILAQNYIIKQLNIKGVSVDAKRLEWMIEAVLKKLKLQYNQNW